MSAARAFDAVAAEYDDRFTGSRIGSRFRETVRRWLSTLFGPGDRVLELGCGTGEDAVWLAGRGVSVTATDVSAAMLEVAEHKASAAPVPGRIELLPLDLARLPVGEGNGGAPAVRSAAAAGSDTGDALAGPFAGAFSNFGALNCIPDRRPVGAWLADRVRPGGRLALVLMGPVCPWEIGWHLARGRPRDAFRRFRRGAEARVGAGRVRVWYPTPARVRRELGPWFRAERLVGIGCVLPPPYLEPWVGRRPVVLEALARWDRRLGAWFPWTWLSDHYLMILERR